MDKNNILLMIFCAMFANMIVAPGLVFMIIDILCLIGIAKIIGKSAFDEPKDSSFFSTKQEQHIEIYLTGKTKPEDVRIVETDIGMEVIIDGDVNIIKATSSDILVKGNAITVSTVSGDVDVGNIGGNVNTTSGDVTAETISGNVSSTSGDIIYQ